MAKDTIIQVNVDDQFLKVMNQPTIASGQVGYTKMKFDVNSYWDSLTLKAMFYVSSSTKYYADITNGVCTVPSEVLASSGNVTVGIYGTPSSGTNVKTSCTDIFKVVEGAVVQVVQSQGDDD